MNYNEYNPDPYGDDLFRKEVNIDDLVASIEKRTDSANGSGDRRRGRPWRDRGWGDDGALYEGDFEIRASDYEDRTDDDDDDFDILDN